MSSVEWLLFRVDEDSIRFQREEPALESVAELIFQFHRPIALSACRSEDAPLTMLIFAGASRYALSLNDTVDTGLVSDPEEVGLRFQFHLATDRNCPNEEAVPS